ncbi:hypothetical protein MRX96_041318 [Rhipicephalus microplus]
MTTLVERPAYAAQNNGFQPQFAPAPNNAASAAETLMVLAILVILMVVCGIGAYFVTANDMENDKIDDSNTSVSHNHKAVITPKLVCVDEEHPDI